MNQFFLFLVLILLSPAVIAQQLPVRLRLEPLSIRGRSGAGIPMQFKLEYNQPGILEGDLFLEIYNSLQMPSDLMATIRYEGIVLQGQDYFFRTTLPPLRHSVTKQYLVVGWFETEKGRIPLTSDPDRLDPPEPHELLTIGDVERATLTCSVSGQSDFLRQSVGLKYISGELSLDQYNPVHFRGASGGRKYSPLPHERVQHYAAPWDALDLPEDPLALTCFDLVLLGDGALSRLRESQMKALLSWLEAGGSLCVYPNQDKLADPQLRFLRTVFTPPDSAVGLSSTDDGRLMVISEVDDAIVNVQYGLGRATLLPDVDDLRHRLQGEAMGAVVAHLWNARSTSAIRKGKPWNDVDLNRYLKRNGLVLHQVEGGFCVLPEGIEPDDPRATRARVPGAMYGAATNYTFDSLESVQNAYGLNADLTPKQAFAATACESALLPAGVEVVPTSVIAGLLLAYVVVIGPVDYFVLGMLRMRKLTWVVFPVVTALFTAMTLAIAGSYMATSDTGRQLVITDVVEGGRAVRETAIHMQFPSSQTTVTEERSRGFVVPLSIARAELDYRTWQVKSIDATDVQLNYSGRFPQKYATTQKLSQWKPVLTRTLKLNPSSEDVPEIPWEDGKLLTTRSGRKQLVASLKRLRNKGREVDAVALNGDRHFPLSGGDAFLFSNSVLRRAADLAAQFQSQRQQLLMGMNPQYLQSGMSQEELLSIAILDLSKSGGQRTFQEVVSRIAPHGAASLEDLPLLDTTNPDEWLLMVAVREGGRTHVYRKLYDLGERTTVIELSAEVTP